MVEKNLDSIINYLMEQILEEEAIELMRIEEMEEMNEHKV